MKFNFHNAVLTVVMVCIATIMACGGGGSGGGGPEDPIPQDQIPTPDDNYNPINHEADVSIQLGIDQLADGDIGSAKTIFCSSLDEYQSEPRAAFGCALTTFLLLTESAPIKRLLAAAGENPIDVNDDIFDENGLFDILMSEYYAPAPTLSYATGDSNAGPSPEDGGASKSLSSKDVHYSKNYPYYGSTGVIDLCDFASFPIVNFMCNYAYGFHIPNSKVFSHLAWKFSENEYSLANAQADLKAYGESLDRVHELLLITRGSGTFYFTIPSKVFYTKDDIKILPADIYAFDLAILSTGFIARLADKYFVDYDLSKINLTETSTNAEALADSLNGVYGKVFGTLNDEEGDFEDLRPIFEEMLFDAKSAVTELRKEGATELFSEIVSGNPSKFDKAELLIEELNDSLVNAALTTLSIFDGARTVKVNLAKFFSSPPNAKSLTDSPDPIDYVKTCEEKTDYYFGSCDNTFEDHSIDGALELGEAMETCSSFEGEADDEFEQSVTYCELTNWGGGEGDYICSCQKYSCVKEAFTYEHCVESFEFVEGFFSKLFSGVLEFSL